jgi:hypothetical protein
MVPSTGESTQNGPFGAHVVPDGLNTCLFPVQESRVATKISLRIKHTPRGIIHEFCCLLKRLLPTCFRSMDRRVLLQGFSRVHGNMFVPLHKVGIASHICHENFDVV